MSEESTNLAMAITASLVSGAATVIFARPVYDTLPDEVKEYLFTSIQSIFNLFSNDFTMVIDELDKLVNNEIYEAAEIYLGGGGAMVNSSSARQLKVSRAVKEKNFNFKMEKEQEIIDVFNGVSFRWRWVVEKTSNFNRFFKLYEETDVHSFKLTFHKKYKKLAIDSYLPFLLNQAKLIKHEKKTVKIFTVTDDSYPWTGIILDHPATFDTLAMDSEQKDVILKDLDRFVKGGNYYRKVGKAWKRGYLLYGPPGTGKSSLIAAIANYLNFNIYDLELTAVKTNSRLRELLVATANKSILVVEDIDCTVELKVRTTNQSAAVFKEKFDTEEEEKGSQMTLSGFLNFIDGLWSSCGDERIIIFTTNHKEKLDPALLRPGRMDVHIHMSYCTPSGFRILVSNYLGLKSHHPLFDEIEKLIQITEVTPAEVAEQLLRHDEAAEKETTLRELTDFLLKKKKEKDAEVDQECKNVRGVTFLKA